MAEFTPISSPFMFTRAPPELPGLMAASVWMASSTVSLVLTLTRGRHRTVQRADDAGRHGARQAQRRADRDDVLADLQIRRRAEGDRRQTRKSLRANDGDVAGGIGTDHAERCGAAVGQRDGRLHGLRTRGLLAARGDLGVRTAGRARQRRHHVIVRQDQPVGVEDDAGSLLALPAHVDLQLHDAGQHLRRHRLDRAGGQIGRTAGRPAPASARWPMRSRDHSRRIGRAGWSSPRRRRPRTPRRRRRTPVTTAPTRDRLRCVRHRGHRRRVGRRAGMAGVPPVVGPLVPTRGGYARSDMVVPQRDWSLVDDRTVASGTAGDSSCAGRTFVCRAGMLDSTVPSPAEMGLRAGSAQSKTFRRGISPSPLLMCGEYLDERRRCAVAEQHFGQPVCLLRARRAAREHHRFVGGHCGVDVAGVRDDPLGEFRTVEHCQVRAVTRRRHQMCGVAEQGHAGHAVPSVTDRQGVEPARLWRDAAEVSPSVIKAVSSGAHPSNSATTRDRRRGFGDVDHPIHSSGRSNAT